MPEAAAPRANASVRRFHCTACGKCCHGSLPLTLADAWKHAGRFPLAMVWTMVPPQGRAFDLVSRIGATVRLGKRQQVAVLIAPTAYLPKSFSCPALAADGRCVIHDDKPLRCRTMPFYPYREERDQADLLRPRQGWDCDISAAAPEVYRNGRIVARDDFDRERSELLHQAPLLRAYSDYMLQFTPLWAESVAQVASRGAGGSIVTSLSSFLTATRPAEVTALAARQVVVLGDYAERTAGHAEFAEYHRNYAGWAREMTYLSNAERRPG